MTEQGFSKGIAVFFAAFSNIKIDKNTLNIWKQLLDDITDNDFYFAILQICREVKEFYPTTNLIALVREQITEKIEDRAMIVWGIVVKIMAQRGAYLSVKFDDPIIHSVIEMMGGWPEFCHIPIDQWMRKEFINAYISLSKNSNHSNHPKYLKGIFEIENRFKGYLDRELDLKIIGTGYRDERKKLVNDVESDIESDIESEFGQKLLSKMKI